MTMKNLCLVVKRVNFNVTSKRTLFNESFLGLDRYYIRKAKESQSSTFKKKFEMLTNNKELKILSHDFKKFIYVINTEEEFKLFSDIFERYAKLESCTPDGIKFQDFVIGPEILRLYYAMNKPVEAFNLLKNSNTSSMICNLPSLIILEDLLYENGMYQEVCDVFTIVKQKQFYKRIFHFAPYVLYQAACYKMDTSESYDNVIAMYEKLIKHNNSPEWPLIMYTLMLALKNCSLDIPIKHAIGVDPASINIKLCALIKSGKYSEALSFCDILDKSLIMKSVAEDLCQALENDGAMQDEFVMKKLKKFQEEIGQKNLIDRTLDELAANVIASLRPNRNKKDN